MIGGIARLSSWARNEHFLIFSSFSYIFSHFSSIFLYSSSSWSSGKAQATPLCMRAKCCECQFPCFDFLRFNRKHATYVSGTDCLWSSLDRNRYTDHILWQPGNMFLRLDKVRYRKHQWLQKNNNSIYHVQWIVSKKKKKDTPTYP